MTDRSTGPRCGNNPNVQLTPGDLKAVDDAKARLALLADARPYIERAVWVDGDPLMEVIAATVWEHCARDDEDMPQLVCDDPRTIAAFAAAVARAHAAVPAPATDQAALRDHIADALYAHDHPGHLVPLNETGMQPAYQESADAVLSVLPAPADRAAVYAEVADRLAADAEQGAKEGFTRIYRRSAAKQVREWGEEPRRMADETQQPEAETPVALEASVVCEGFQWIGQSFATCDRCGQPAWEHAGEEVPVEGAGLFDNRRTVRPWKPGEADRIRAKWGTPAAVQQPKEA